jgi:hypothetical protein
MFATRAGRGRGPYLEDFEVEAAHCECPVGGVLCGGGGGGFAMLRELSKPMESGGR